MPDQITTPAFRSLVNSSTDNSSPMNQDLLFQVDVVRDRAQKKKFVNIATNGLGMTPAGGALVGAAVSYGVVESESNGAVVEQYAPDNSNGSTSVATTNGFTVTEAVSPAGPALQVSFSSSTTNTTQYSDFRLSTHKSRTDVGSTTIDHYYKLIDLYHTTGPGGAVRPYAYNSA